MLPQIFPNAYIDSPLRTVFESMVRFQGNHSIDVVFFDTHGVFSIALPKGAALFSIHPRDFGIHRHVPEMPRGILWSL